MAVESTEVARDKLLDVTEALPPLVARPRIRFGRLRPSVGSAGLAWAELAFVLESRLVILSLQSGAHSTGAG